jgi:hypothetical protein
MKELKNWRNWMKLFLTCGGLAFCLFEPSFAIDILDGVGSEVKSGVGDGTSIQLLIGVISVIVGLVVFFFQKNLVMLLTIIAVPQIVLKLFNGGFI